MHQNEKLRVLAEDDIKKAAVKMSMDVTLKHILRQFFFTLNINIEAHDSLDVQARATMSRSDLAAIRSYLSSANDVEEFSKRERVKAALQNFLTREVWLIMSLQHFNSCI